MTVTFYKNLSDKKVVKKNITSGKAYTSVILKDNCTIKNPVLEISDMAIMLYNYAYITEFKRYYYVSTEVIRNGLVRCVLNCDLLMSAKDYFLPLNAILKRQESVYNLYLDDPLFMTYNNKEVTTQKFTGSQLTKNAEAILIVAG